MIGAVVKVDPVGTERAHGFRHFTDGHVETSWDQPVYPPHPQGQAFRDARVAAGVGLRDASKRLGLSPEIVSGLERGRYQFADAADWTRAREAIEGTGT